MRPSHLQNDTEISKKARLQPEWPERAAMQTWSEVGAHEGTAGVAGLGLDQHPFPVTQSQSARLPFGCEHVEVVCLRLVQLQKHDSGTTLQKSVVLVAPKSASASALPAANSIGITCAI